VKLARLFFVILFLPVFSSAQTTINLLGRLTYGGVELSNIWGYADSLGNEYALVGTQQGTSIVDVTDPTNPVQVRFVAGTNSDWREIKTWGHYAYVVNEGGGGLQIINLANLPGPVTAVNRVIFGNYYTFHTLFIDENGVLYLNGGNTSGGTVMLDVAANPTNPPLLGVYSNRYVHDCFARGDTLWTAEVNNGEFSVIDVSDKMAPVLLERQATSFNFTHNLWLKPGGNILLTTDERSGAYIDAYDVSDVNNIERLGLFQSVPGTGTIPHNVYWHNDFGVASYYRAGVVVFDPTYPSQMVEVGHYDTSPLSGNGFNGAWGVYPFLPSGNIIVSDIEQGLFVLGVNYRKASYIQGTLTDNCTGDTLQGVTVQINNTTYSAVTDFDGHYLVVLPDSGNFSLTYYKAGYLLGNTTVHFENGITANGNMQLAPIVPEPVAAFTPSDSIVCQGSSITFTDVSTGQCLSRQWIFDGGFPSSSTDSVVQVSFGAGSHTVQLVAITTGGYDTAEVTINVQPQPITNITATGTSCFGGADGSVSVIVSGGNAGYSVLWSTGETGFEADSLAAGFYSSTVTDTLGCSVTDSITLPSGDTLAFEVLTTPETYSGAGDGTALVNITGGNGIPTYAWSVDTTWTGPGLIGLSAGTYIVTVTLNRQCADTASFTIDLASGITNISTEEITLSPNPFYESIYISLPADERKVMLNIYSAEGKMLFSQTVNSPINWGKDVEPGIYFARVKISQKPERYYKLVKIH
jgi:choice-of-anchor B domain-containing protein